MGSVANAGGLTFKIWLWAYIYKGTGVTSLHQYAQCRATIYGVKIDVIYNTPRVTYKTEPADSSRGTQDKSQINAIAAATAAQVGERPTVATAAPKVNNYFSGWTGAETYATLTMGTPKKFYEYSGDEITFTANFAAIPLIHSTGETERSTQTMMYDGTNQGPKINLTGYILTGLYKGRGGTTYAESGTMPKNVGTYYLNGTVKVGTEVVGTLTDYGFEITRRTLSLVPTAGQSKIYGENDPALTYGWSANKLSGETPAMSGALVRAAGNDVGNYAIAQGSLVWAGSANFLLTNYDLSFDGSKTFEIKKRTLTVTSPSALSRQYDGTTVVTVGGTLSGVQYSETADVVALASAGSVSGKDVSATPYPVTFSIVGTGIGNYQLTQPVVTMTVSAKVIYITPDSVSKTYGDLDPVFNYTSSDAVAGESKAFNGALSRVTNTVEDGGTYSITMGNLFPRNNGAFLAANYVLQLQGAASLTINKAALAVTWVGDVYTYNGSVQKPAASVVAIGLKYSDLAPTLSYTGDTSVSAVGEYSVTAALSNINYFLAGANLTRSFSIIKVKLSVSWTDAGHVYDKTPYRPYAALAGAIVGGEQSSVDSALSYSTAGFVNAGSYTVSVLLSHGSYEVTGGNLSCSFVIDQATLGVSWDTPSFVYNGLVQRPSANIVSGVISPDNPGLIYGPCSNINAGSGYTASIAGSTDSNYKVTSNLLTTYSIGKKTITATNAYAAGKVYDGNNLVDGYTVLFDGLVGNERLSVIIDYTASAVYDDETVGESKPVTVSNIVLTASGKAANYDLIGGIFNTAANISRAYLTVTGWTYRLTDYNAAAQSPEAVIPGISDELKAKLVYKNIPSNTDCSANIDAGNYTISVSLENSSNYVLTTATHTYTIRAARIAVDTVTAANKLYDGTGSAEITVAFTNLQGGQSFVLGEDFYASASFAAYDANTGITVYVDDIRLTGNAARNYMLQGDTSFEVSADILPADVQSADGVTVFYLESVAGAVVLGAGISGQTFEGIVDWVTLSSLYPEVKDSGEYEVYFTPADPNYKTTLLRISLEVKPIKTEFSVSRERGKLLITDCPAAEVEFSIDGGKTWSKDKVFTVSDYKDYKVAMRFVNGDQNLNYYSDDVKSDNIASILVPIGIGVGATIALFLLIFLAFKLAKYIRKHRKPVALAKKKKESEKKKKPAKQKAEKPAKQKVEKPAKQKVEKPAKAPAPAKKPAAKPAAAPAKKTPPPAKKPAHANDFMLNMRVANSAKLGESSRTNIYKPRG